jgi:hypothetical protein
VQLLAQKLSGGPGRPKLMSPFCGPPNWQTSSFLFIVDKNYCIFSTKGRFAIFGFGEQFNYFLMFLGRFIKLIAFSVTAVASG